MKKLFDKRRLTQVICAILYNCNLTGFAKGTIFRGGSKAVCVPGLNCYSCPGAVAACPLGSLQSALVGSKFRIPYYILGMLILFGVLFGRMICAFFCPFGLIQELLYKIPLPKIKKNKVTRILSYGKYVMLAVLILWMPIAFGYPAFCKYVCPAGTLEAGVPLLIKNEALRKLADVLFNWKMGVLILIILMVIFLYRGFCRFICPLGAIYSFFNKVSVFGVEVNADLCTGCNACVNSCKLDVKKVGDRECIQCGECITKCNVNAIKCKHNVRNVEK